MVPIGFPPLKELMQLAVERGVPIYVCGGCAPASGIRDADLQGKNARFTTPPEFAQRCAEATNVLVFQRKGTLGAQRRTCSSV